MQHKKFNSLSVFSSLSEIALNTLKHTMVSQNLFLSESLRQFFQTFLQANCSLFCLVQIVPIQ